MRESRHGAMHETWVASDVAVDKCVAEELG